MEIIGLLIGLALWRHADALDRETAARDLHARIAVTNASQAVWRWNLWASEFDETDLASTTSERGLDIDQVYR